MIKRIFIAIFRPYANPRINNQERSRIGRYRLIILSITEETRRALLSDEELLAEDCRYWSRKLSWSLANCKCGLGNPRTFYETYFSQKGVTLDYVQDQEET